MNDIVPESGGYTPTNVLAKQGVAAVAGLAGGVILMIIRALPSVIGIIGGGLIAVVGISALLSKDPADKKGGIVAAIAGGLTILAKTGIFGGLANALLSLGTLGLLGLGIWNGIKFLKGLKSRS